MQEAFHFLGTRLLKFLAVHVLMASHHVLCLRGPTGSVLVVMMAQKAHTVMRGSLVGMVGAGAEFLEAALFVACNVRRLLSLFIRTAGRA